MLIFGLQKKMYVWQIRVSCQMEAALSNIEGDLNEKVRAWPVCTNAS